MMLDLMLQRLDAISGDSEAARFASAVAQQLRTMRGSITRLAEQKADLENQASIAKKEAAKAHKAAARRMGETTRIHSAHSILKEQVKWRGQQIQQLEGRSRELKRALKTIANLPSPSDPEMLSSTLQAARDTALEALGEDKEQMP